MSEQEHPGPVRLALDLGRFDRTAAHNAGMAGASTGPGYAIDNGQSSLQQPGTRLTLQFLVGDAMIITHSEEPYRPDDDPLSAWDAWRNGTRTVPR